MYLPIVRDVSITWAQQRKEGVVEDGRHVNPNGHLQQLSADSEVIRCNPSTHSVIVTDTTVTGVASELKKRILQRNAVSL